MRQVYNWPNFQNSKMVNKDGYLTPEWSMILQQFFGFAQNNLSNEGYRLPQQTTANITAIVGNPSDPNVPSGTMFYNTDLDVPQVIINGVIKTFTVT